VEFRVLGPIEFWAAGKRQELGSAKERLLLAVLLLAEGRPVAIDSLIDRIWDENPPPEVRQSLQTDVSRLRRRFKACKVSDRVQIVGTPGAYALEVDPQDVDVLRSRILRDQAMSIWDSGDVHEGAKLLHEAIDLWRSVPLTGLTGDWVDQARASLDGDFRAMAHEVVKIELALANHAGITSFLLDMTGRYPLDEQFIEQLMLAYYRCGRQVDAIGLYRDTTDMLRESTGSDPLPSLQKLYQSILRHDPSLEPPARSRSEVMLGRLPTPVPDFTGRVSELARLADNGTVLDAVVSIEGMPGIGKSTLAVKLAHQLAERFPDGCVHLHLNAHDPQRPPVTPNAALSSLLRAIGVVPGRIPRDLADRARLWREKMKGRRALIVLDDAADSDQVRPLLPANPNCHVIITSRRHLGGIDGVHHHRLDGLPPADAAALFVRIAGSEASSSDLVGEVIRRCAGIPLVIRQAASRLRDGQTSSIEALAEELRGPFDDIADLQDPALAGTFELSYRDLSPVQQRVFRRLGLSPASELTAPAVAALTDTSVTEAERNLAGFVEHCLLEEIAPGRFQLHDLVRQYTGARARVEESTFDQRFAAGRTLDYYLLTADLADRLLYPHHPRTDIVAAADTVASGGIGSERAAREWLAAERGNLTHLVRYAADHEFNLHVIDLARTVARHLDSGTHWEDAETIQLCALKVALNMEIPRAIAQVRLDLSIVQARVGQIPGALANATSAQDIAHGTRDLRLEATAQDQIGVVLWASSDYPGALAYFSEAIDIYREIGDTHGEAKCLGHTGMILAHIGRYQEALRSFEEAIDLHRMIGDKRGEANILNNIANTQLQLGYHRDAHELFVQSQNIYRTISGRRNNAILLINFGDVARYRGNLSRALKLYRTALAEFTATGDRINQPNVLNNIGMTLAEMNKYNEALIHHKKALSIADEVGNVSENIRARLGIATTDLGTGRYPAAEDGYRASLKSARHTSEPYLEAQALVGIAKVTNLTQGHTAARIYWRQAYDLYAQMGILPEMEAVRLHLEITDLADS
jgi:DNA-binding SARP family transcriptional activator/tetratricopeptide (TPR) repeat protein